MEDEPVLREALTRRDAALAEARRLDEFVRMYNELRGSRPSAAKYGDVVGLQSTPLSVVAESPRNGSSDSLAGEFMLDKTRPTLR